MGARLRKVPALVAAACAAAMAGAAQPGAPRDPPVAYTLSPEFAGNDLTALRVVVRYRADGKGDADFAWSRSWAGETHLAQWARDVHVEGAREVHDDGAGRWRIRGAPGASITVSYRVVSAFDHDPNVDEGWDQPQPLVRPGWFYAVGEALFGTPEGRDEAPATFRWTGERSGLTFASDLEHLAGPGRPALRPGTVADVRESIAFGGRDLHVFRGSGATAHVRVALRGRFSFTDAQFDALVRRLIATERAFWGDGPEAPFLVTAAPVIGRPPHANFSGTGRTDAFALWYDTSASLHDAVWLLAHEYFHTWDPRQLGGWRDGDEAVEPLGYWFSEGFTDYYARRLALASGAWSLQDFADAWNGALKGYDLSPRRNTPNADIPHGTWRDPDLQQLPYGRGSLIAAVLDARLRAASPGSGGLDALLREQRRLAAARRKTPDMDASLLFREVLRRRRPDLDAWVEGAAIRGETVELPSDAFAPCFEVTTTSTPSFDRGFDMAATIRNGRHVTGLEPGGPAARAGLHEGDLVGIDESTAPDPAEARRYRVHEAGGGTHVVTYLPQGPEVQVQQLRVTPGLTQSQVAACARSFGARAS